MNRSTLLVPAILLLGSLTSVRAQDVRTLPKALHNAGGQSDQVIDGTFPSFSYQAWFRGDNLPQGYVINAIGQRGNHNQSSTAYTADAQLEMENTAVTFATLSTTLANNVSANATVVVAKKPVNVPARAPATDQGVHQTKANPAGLATTNTFSSIFGNVGGFNSVFSLDGITAYTGWPWPVNASTIYLLK